MSKKEIQFGDNNFHISKRSNSGFITSSNFSATIRQLEVLSEIERQGSVKKAEEELDLSESTMRGHIVRLQQQNRRDEENPTLGQLILQAKQYELLDQERLLEIREILDVELAHERAPSRVRRRLQVV